MKLLHSLLRQQKCRLHFAPFSARCLSALDGANFPASACRGRGGSGAAAPASLTWTTPGHTIFVISSSCCSCGGSRHCRWFCNSLLLLLLLLLLLQQLQIELVLIHLLPRRRQRQLIRVKLGETCHASDIICCSTRACTADVTNHLLLKRLEGLHRA